MTDWELIGERLMPAHVTNPMEMNRRLKVALTELKDETRQALQSADKLASLILGWTVFLALLTLALVALTIADLSSR